MDEVGWEAVLLLQCVGLPGGEQGTQSGLRAWPQPGPRPSPELIGLVSLEEETPESLLSFCLCEPTKKSPREHRVMGTQLQAVRRGLRLKSALLAP